MALNDVFNDLIKGNIVTGLAVGVGAAVLAPVVVPAVARIGKPVAKMVIKTGILAYERGRETLAELGEAAEDMVAEAKAELVQEQDHRTVGERQAAAAGRVEPSPQSPQGSQGSESPQTSA